MRLSAIALDYDGTVARCDALDPSVRGAIAAARTKGIAVLLVTGRILEELRRVAGDLHFVDPGASSFRRLPGGAAAPHHSVQRGTMPR